MIVEDRGSRQRQHRDDAQWLYQQFLYRLKVCIENNHHVLRVRLSFVVDFYSEIIWSELSKQSFIEAEALSA